MFKNPFSFHGRIRRTEYGLSCIIFSSAVFLLGVASTGSLSTNDQIGLLVLFVPFAWFMLAQGAKRCHDMGHNAWYQLNPLYVLRLPFTDGEPDANDFGEDPKGTSDLLQMLLIEKDEEA
jgi:uncharacterized membrane protein YhaH (DUF805 family)